MAKPLSLPLVNEETARLKWFEAFMRGRMELEQQTIASLQVLLEGAPPLPNQKLLWHCALEQLLDGTREELHARIEGLDILKNQIQTMGDSIVKAETSIHDLGIEFDKLESAENVDSAEAATATSYKDWLDTKSVSVSVQKDLSYLFSSDRARKEKLENEERMKSDKAHKVRMDYYKQDLGYRHTVHQQRESREQFLNSIPDRIQVKPVPFVWVVIDWEAQEHGTKYWTAVRDVGTVMESFANYIWNISSTCNSSGSAIWASAKNIKPLVDANCHTEAIDVAYHQSPMRGQTILFGAPLELRIVGELKKIPAILEYLLDLVHDWQSPPNSPHVNSWSLANRIEQAWTGVEESDRAMVSQLAKGHQRLLIQEYFVALPKPVLSKDDIQVIRNGQASSPILTWNTWSEDPIKKAVFVAINPWIVHAQPYRTNLVYALAHNWSLPDAQRVADVLCAYHDSLKGPVTNVEEEIQ